MSTVIAPSAIEKARAIRREVMEAGWPQSRDAQWAIGWALGELDDILTIRDRLLNDDLDPYAVHAPDMAFWDAGNPLPQALEYIDDQALQCAEGLAKRLCEYKAREDAHTRGDEAA